MIARLRKPEDLAATLACFGIAGAALALGMWIAGRPLTVPPATVAVTPSAAAPGDIAAERVAAGEWRQ